MDPLKDVNRKPSKFQTFDEVNTYQTRNVNKLFISYFSSVQGPFITSLRIYNHLPDYLKCERNLTKKRQIKYFFKVNIFNH